MLKKIIVGTLVALFVVGGLFSYANAQSMTISQLVELFISLGIIAPEKATAARSAVAGTTSVGTPGSVGGNTCYSFTYDFGVGAPVTGAAMSALSDILTREGISGANSTVFDEDFSERVVRFQAKYGIRQTGYVGPITRAKLNSISCTTTTPETPISIPIVRREPSGFMVIYPNGGETFTQGTKQVISWQNSSVESCVISMSAGITKCPLSDAQGTYDIYLQGTATCSGNICTTGFPVYTISKGVIGTSYNWIVGNADVKGGAPNGDYRIQVCESGTNNCDESDRYFKLVSSASASATIDQGSLTTSSSMPTLTGSAYNVTQFGIAISGPSGDKVWGSGTIPVYNNRWSTTVTYNLSPGVYYVHVSSNNVIIAEGTLFITSSTDSKPSIQVTSPVGGTYKLGSVPNTGDYLSYSATANNVKSDGVFSMYMTDKNDGTGKLTFVSSGSGWDLRVPVVLGGAIPMSEPYYKPGTYYLYFEWKGYDGSFAGVYSKAFNLVSSTGSASATIDQGSLTTSSSMPTLTGSAYNVTEFGISLSDAGGKIWGSGTIPVYNNRWSTTINQNLNPGTYTVHVYSNNILVTTGTLVVTSSSVQPSVTVLSPNGGETWTQGTTQTIKWSDIGPFYCSTAEGYPCPMPTYDIKLTTECLDDSMCSAQFVTTDVVKGVSGSSYVWTAGNANTAGGAPNGAFRIQVCRSGTNICDISDSYFKLVSPTVTTNQYHSADTNKDWKISDIELQMVTYLYNYREGTTRTGEYHVEFLTTTGSAGNVSTMTYVSGPGNRVGATHSADSNKDWKISLTELTRVIELKNASGYTVQAGTEDGFAPIYSSTGSGALNYQPSNTASVYFATDEVLRLINALR